MGGWIMATRECPMCRGRGKGKEFKKTMQLGWAFAGYDYSCPTCRGTGKQHQEWVAGT